MRGKEGVRAEGMAGGRKKNPGCIFGPWHGLP